MSMQHYWKPLVAIFMAVSLLTACTDRDKIAASGMVKSSDGTPIRYQSQGQGDTAIIFVHCWTCDHSFWNAQYNAFATQYKVVRLDLAGHGTSASRKTYSMTSYADDVVAVANALKLQRIVLVGHSMGGPVSVEAERQLGNRVIGVVGVDTFYTAFSFPADEAGINAFVKPFIDNFTESRTGMMRSMFAPGADPALVDRTAAAIPVSAQDMAVQSMYDVFRWSAQEGPERLKTLGKKLHNINGDPAGKGERLDDSVVLIAGTGHFPHMEKPAEFNQALLGILGKLAK